MSDKNDMNDWHVPDYDSQKEGDSRRKSNPWVPEGRSSDKNKPKTSYVESGFKNPSSQQGPNKKPMSQGLKRLILFIGSLLLLIIGLNFFYPNNFLFDSPGFTVRILWVLLIGGVFVYFSKASNKALFKNSMIWLAIALVSSGFYYLSDFEQKDLYNNSNNTLSLTKLSDGSFMVDRSPDGHFWVMTTINGHELPMMVDTGASMVVLSKRDAKIVGIDIDQINFSGRSSTANGVVPYGRINVDEFVVGNLLFNKFSITVNGGKMRGSLLGLEALDEFNSYEVRGDQLILRP